MQPPNYFMQLALEQAKLAEQCGEVPIGAVITDAAGNILASAHNLTETTHDATAHAELLAIRTACQATGSARLTECDLYVTLEPCAMCASAISHARLRRVYFGAYDPKGGGIEHGPRFYTQPTCHHRPEVYGGIAEAGCGAVLKGFFKVRR